MTQVQGWPPGTQLPVGPTSLVWPDEQVSTRVKQQIPHPAAWSWGGSLNPATGVVARNYWTSTSRSWASMCWSPELRLFCAVSNTGTGTRAATSPDGKQWTLRNTPADNSWTSVCWSPELRLFCAVSETGTNDRVMTSPDGVTWTSRASAANNNWRSVCWSPELRLFCAVGSSGSNNRVMTSPDGVTWTIRSIPVNWSLVDVIWVEPLRSFVACSILYTNSTVSYFATSPNGITWTNRNSGANLGNCYGISWLPSQKILTALIWPYILFSSDLVNWTSVIYDPSLSSTAVDKLTELPDSDRCAWMSTNGRFTLINKNFWRSVDNSPKFSATSSHGTKLCYAPELRRLCAYGTGVISLSPP